MNVKLQAESLVAQIDKALQNVGYLLNAAGLPQLQIDQLDECASALTAARIEANGFLLDNRLTITPERERA